MEFPSLEHLKNLLDNQIDQSTTEAERYRNKLLKVYVESAYVYQADPVNYDPEKMAEATIEMIQHTVGFMVTILGSMGCDADTVKTVTDCIYDEFLERQTKMSEFRQYFDAIKEMLKPKE